MVSLHFPDHFTSLKNTEHKWGGRSFKITFKISREITSCHSSYKCVIWTWERYANTRVNEVWLEVEIPGRRNCHTSVNKLTRITVSPGQHHQKMCYAQEAIICQSPSQRFMIDRMKYSRHHSNLWNIYFWIYWVSFIVVVAYTFCISIIYTFLLSLISCCNIQ